MFPDIQWVSVCHTQTYLHKQTKLGDITVCGYVPSRGQDCTPQVRAATSVTPLLPRIWSERDGRMDEAGERGEQTVRREVWGDSSRGCQEQLPGVNQCA